jgi:hypothetical protein
MTEATACEGAVLARDRDRLRGARPCQEPRGLEVPSSTSRSGARFDASSHRRGRCPGVARRAHDHYLALDGWSPEDVQSNLSQRRSAYRRGVDPVAPGRSRSPLRSARDADPGDEAVIRTGISDLRVGQAFAGATSVPLPLTEDTGFAFTAGDLRGRLRRRGSSSSSTRPGTRREASSRRS